MANSSVKELIEFLEAGQDLAHEIKDALADGKVRFFEGLGVVSSIAKVVQESEDIEIIDLLASSPEERRNLVEYVMEQEDASKLKSGVVVWLIEVAYTIGNLLKALK